MRRGLWCVISVRGKEGNFIRRGLWCVISVRGKEGDRDLVYYSATARYYAITMHFKRKVIVFSSSWRFLLNLSTVFHNLANHWRKWNRTVISCTSTCTTPLYKNSSSTFASFQSWGTSPVSIEDWKRSWRGDANCGISSVLWALLGLS